MNTAEWFEKHKRLYRATDRPAGPMDFKLWQREQREKLVDKTYPEIASELWKHGITGDNPYIARWLMEVMSFSRMTAHKMRRRLKRISPLILLALEAPDERDLSAEE